MRLARLAARGTVRLRLTLLYTALFATLGAALLGITYGLVAQSLPPQSSPEQVKPAPGGKVALPDICQVAKIDPGLLSKCKAAFNEGVVTGASSQRDETLHNLLVISLLALALMTLISAGLGGGWPDACCARCTRSPPPPCARRRTTSASGSRSAAPTTSSSGWPTPSTRCSAASTARSRPSSASSPTPRTSCARR